MADSMVISLCWLNWSSSCSAPSTVSAISELCNSCCRSSSQDVNWKIGTHLFVCYVLYISIVVPIMFFHFFLILQISYDLCKVLNSMIWLICIKSRGLKISSAQHLLWYHIPSITIKIKVNFIIGKEHFPPIYIGLVSIFSFWGHHILNLFPNGNKNQPGVQYFAAIIYWTPFPMGNLFKLKFWKFPPLLKENSKILL